MNQIKSLIAFLLMLVATLFTASDVLAFALGNHAGEFFSGTLDCAGGDGPGARNPCWKNGWLNYDTLSGYCVATKTPAYRLISSDANKLDNIEIPLGNWGKGPHLEPFAKDFPDFGFGRASQRTTTSEILIDKLVDRRTGEVLFER